jgi:hypothetical protein
VNADRHTTLGPNALSEADVIAVRVREHDRSDIFERAPHRRELRWKCVPVARHAGVDDRHGPRFLE